MIMISETVLDFGTVRLVVEGHMEEQDLKSLQDRLDRHSKLNMVVEVDVSNLRNFDIRWHHWIREIRGKVEWIGLPPYILSDWS